MKITIKKSQKELLNREKKIEKGLITKFGSSLYEIEKLSISHYGFYYLEFLDEGEEFEEAIEEAEVGQKIIIEFEDHSRNGEVLFIEDIKKVEVCKEEEEETIGANDLIKVIRNYIEGKEESDVWEKYLKDNFTDNKDSLKERLEDLIKPRINLVANLSKKEEKGAEVIKKIEEFINGKDEEEENYRELAFYKIFDLFDKLELEYDEEYRNVIWNGIFERETEEEVIDFQEELILNALETEIENEDLFAELRLVLDKEIRNYEKLEIRSCLKKAYYNCGKRFHPDKQAGKSEEEIKLAEERFKAIGNAYNNFGKKETEKKSSVLTFHVSSAEKVGEALNYAVYRVKIVKGVKDYKYFAVPKSSSPDIVTSSEENIEKAKSEGKGLLFSIDSGNASFGEADYEVEKDSLQVPSFIVVPFDLSLLEEEDSETDETEDTWENTEFGEEEKVNGYLSDSHINYFYWSLLLGEGENIRLNERGIAVCPVPVLQKGNCLLADSNEVQGFINPLLGAEISGLRSEEVRFVFFPVNNGRIGDSKSGSGSHWTLLVWDKDTNQAYEYDSLGSTAVSDAAQTIVNKLRDLSEHEVILTPKPTPRQIGADCGVFVGAITELLINKCLANPDTALANFSEAENNLIIGRITPIREWLHAERQRSQWLRNYLKDDDEWEEYILGESYEGDDLSLPRDSVINKLGIGDHYGLGNLFGDEDYDGEESPLQKFVDPRYRENNGLVKLGIVNSEEATRLANIISNFLNAHDSVRHLLAQCEPKVVESFRVIIDIFKSLTEHPEADRFVDELSDEDKRLINHHLSEENVEAIREVSHRFFDYEDGDWVAKDLEDIRIHYQDVILPLRVATGEAEKRITDYLWTIGATSEEINEIALKKGLSTWQYFLVQEAQNTKIGEDADAWSVETIEEKLKRGIWHFLFTEGNDIAALKDDEKEAESKGWWQRGFQPKDAQKAFKNGWRTTGDSRSVITNKNYDDLENSGLAISYRGNEYGIAFTAQFLDPVNVMNTTYEEAVAWNDFFREGNKLNEDADREKRAAWRNSGLSPVKPVDIFGNEIDGIDSDAQVTWNNNWRAEDPNINFNSDGKSLNYQTNLRGKIVTTSDVDHLNVDRQFLLVLHEILTDIANENEPNNLIAGSDIDHQIDLLTPMEGQLPTGSKQRAIDKMNAKHDILLANNVGERASDDKKEETPDTPSQKPDLYQQSVAKLEQVFNKARQEIKDVKNASLEQIEKAIAYLEPYAEAIEESDKLAWENNSEVKTLWKELNQQKTILIDQQEEDWDSGFEDNDEEFFKSKVKPTKTEEIPFANPNKDFEEIIQKAQRVIADDEAGVAEIQEVIDEIEGFSETALDKDEEKSEQQQQQQQQQQQLKFDLVVKLISKQPLPEAINIAKKTIVEILTKNQQIKVDDLGIPDLAGEKWENHLERMQTSVQVANFVQQMQREVARLQENQVNKSSLTVDSAENNDNQSWKIVLGVTGGIFILGLTGLIIKQIVKTKKIKN